MYLLYTFNHITHKKKTNKDQVGTQKAPTCKSNTWWCVVVVVVC